MGCLGGENTILHQCGIWLPLLSNRENRKHQKYFWNDIVLQEKSQSGMGKLNSKQGHELI